MIEGESSQKPVRPRDWFIANLAILLVAVATYSITLTGGFVYDDVGAIVEDKRVTDVSQWGKLWTGSLWKLSPDRLYRPLPSQSYAVQWWMTPHTAYPFHIVNILLHGVASLLVVSLGRVLFGSIAGLMAGLLFAVHPVHVEAVANIVGRAELMCTSGILIALVLCHRRPITIWKGIAIACAMIGALLSKEQALCIPMLLIALWMCQDHPKAMNPPESLAIKWGIVMVCYLFFGYVVFRELILNLKMTVDPKQFAWMINPIGYSSGFDRIMLPLTVLGHYVVLVLWPIYQSADYSGAVVGDQFRWSDPYSIIGIVSLMALLGLSVWAWRTKRKTVLFCLFGFALTYVMIGNVLMLIGTVVAERLLYLPSVFACLLLGAVLAAIRWQVRTVLLILLVPLAIYRSAEYSYCWNNQDRLLERSMASQPKIALVRSHLISRLLETGQYERAAKLAKEGREYSPKDEVAWINSARAAVELGHYAEARSYLRTANKVDLLQYSSEIEAEINRRESAAKSKSQP